MRQTSDTKFIDLLNNSCFCDDTTSQLGILYERRRAALIVEFEDNADRGKYIPDRKIN